MGSVCNNLVYGLPENLSIVGIIVLLAVSGLMDQCTGNVVR